MNAEIHTHSDNLNDSNPSDSGDSEILSFGSQFA